MSATSGFSGVLPRGVRRALACGPDRVPFLCVVPLLLSPHVGAASPVASPTPTPTPMAVVSPRGGDVSRVGRRPPMLRIHGLVRGGQALSLSPEAFEKGLKRLHILTSAFRDETPRLFEGASFADLVDLYGTKSVRSVRVVALDGYEQTLALGEAASWGCLLAVRAEGVPIPVSQRGPFRVVCDTRERPPAEREVMFASFVWQVKELEFR